MRTVGSSKHEPVLEVAGARAFLVAIRFSERAGDDLGKGMPTRHLN